MMAERCPELAQSALEELEKGVASRAECLKAARVAKQTLLAEAFDTCPSWRELYHNKKPPQQDEHKEPGEFYHG